MVPHLLQLYRTPTPDLLVRLGRVRADWRGGGPAPADGRPRPPVPFVRASEAHEGTIHESWYWSCTMWG